MLRPRNQKDFYSQKVRAILNRYFDVKPKDISWYLRSFTHKSFNEDQEDLPNNERLEFLGDAFLSAFCASYLFEKLPQKSEGDLTKLKSKIVSRSFLNHLAKELYLPSVIRHKLLNQKINDSSLPGNTFEALIGAIYLDQGYKAVEKSLQFVFTNFIDLEKVKIQQRDFKSLLWEFAQKERFAMSSEIIDEREEENRKIYTVKVFADNGLSAVAEAKSKKKAEQAASMEILKSLGKI